MRAQPVLEFLSVYSWAIIGIAIFFAIAVVLSGAQSLRVYPPSTCYITPSFPCYSMYLMTNSLGSNAILIFNNGVGSSIVFSGNSFIIRPVFSSTSYNGICQPQIAGPGASVICYASLPITPGFGTEYNPSFQISYQICAPCSANTPVYNTSGSATVYASPLTANTANIVATNTIILSGNNNYINIDTYSNIEITGNSDNVIATLLGSSPVNVIVTGNSDRLRLTSGEETLGISGNSDCATLVSEVSWISVNGNSDNVIPQGGTVSSNAITGNSDCIGSFCTGMAPRC